MVSPGRRVALAPIKDIAPDLARMGLTGIWLPPAYKCSGGIHDVGYGVYDMYDLGEFDQKGTIPTKYGTKDEYLDAVQTLKRHHIKVITDIVFNHRMGADEQETVEAIQDNTQNRTESISGPKPISSWTKFTFPGRGGRYDDFVWDHTCFKGVDYDGSTGNTGIFRMEGKEWDTDVDPEEGNYDYLMGCDVDVDNPAVYDELVRWGKWYCDTVRPDGFRLDAVKHINFSFFPKWLKEMRGYTGKDLPAVGEYWSPDIGRLNYFLEKCGGCMMLFDVPLHFHFLNVSNCMGNSDMGSILNDTLTKSHPESAVTFVDNHDTQPGQSLASFIPGWFKPLAYSLILLQKSGIPCVFYGDLYGIPGSKIPPVKGLPLLISIREKLAYGEERDYYDDCNIVGFTREGDDEHEKSGLAVIMTDQNGGSRTMCVGAKHAGAEFIDALGNQEKPVTIDADGNGTFTCSGGSVSVYIRRDAKLPESAPAG